jgi:hypothetical protein
LLGAVLGGLLEFSSMLVGIGALSLIALALYLLAAGTASRADAVSEAEAAESLEPG